MFSKTRLRGFIAAVITIIVLVVFVAIAAKVLGWNIPGLSAITDSLGI
jgi:hypothetical protein